jgi:hypothetical protein
MLVIFFHYWPNLPQYIILKFYHLKHIIKSLKHVDVVSTLGCRRTKFNFHTDLKLHLLLVIFFPFTGICKSLEWKAALIYSIEQHFSITGPVLVVKPTD